VGLSAFAWLCRAVDWPGLRGYLRAQAGPVARDAARFYETADIYHPIAAGFAALVCSEHYPDLRGAVYGHLGGPDLDVAEDLAQWLVATGHTVLNGAVAMAAPATPRTPAPLGTLLIDPELPALPHLELAAELAAAIGGLTVQPSRTLPAGHLGGRYSRRTRVIELDGVGADLPAAWRHELGHAIDPDFRARGTNEADEAFADLFRDLLAVHDPAGLAEALPLINQARETVQMRPRERPSWAPEPPGTTALPAPGAESLCAFVALPLLRVRASA
jgi:hypothetical protein